MSSIDKINVICRLAYVANNTPYFSSNKVNIYLNSLRHETTKKDVIKEEYEVVVTIDDCIVAYNCSHDKEDMFRYFLLKCKRFDISKYKEKVKNKLLERDIE